MSLIVREVNTNFTTGGDSTLIHRACVGADVLLLQEAKFTLADLLPDGWAALQDTTSEATRGSCIAYRSAAASVVDWRLVQGSLAGSGIMARHILWADIEDLSAPGHVGRFISAHRPPKRARALWPSFDRSMLRLVASSQGVVLGMDANQDIAVVGNKYGLEEVGSNVFTALFTGSDVVATHPVIDRRYPKRLTDHPVVTLTVTLPTRKETPVTYRYLIELANVLRAGGLTVVEVKGWQTRGRPKTTGGFNPVGVLWHHTGGDGNDLTYATWLALTGRPDLPAPLCQLSIDRKGTVYVLAAGRANHAGKAKASGTVAAGDGNALYIGVECMNTGTEGWTPEQYGAMVLTGAALAKYLGTSVQTQRGHKETSVTGKWDPGALDMDKFRKAIQARIDSSTPTPPVVPPVPKPAPKPTPAETIARLRNLVRKWRRRARAKTQPPVAP